MAKVAKDICCLRLHSVRSFVGRVITSFRNVAAVLLASHRLTMENVCDFQFTISLQPAAQGQSQSIVSSRTRPRTYVCEVTTTLKP